MPARHAGYLRYAARGPLLSSRSIFIGGEKKRVWKGIVDAAAPAWIDNELTCSRNDGAGDRGHLKLKI
ncbi:hypothetical protein EVAR_62009_1 [Eumeta japonica]|uniref:Uncharacterized protein n=1 Tax=Eumeta variegata TaxID=151549 RepID=A0A4C1ZSU7_EUMVA|nr:hypothetical protein EVAR_62009_1 [Eumeta japonica]